jgi:hypothetical protein
MMLRTILLAIVVVTPAAAARVADTPSDLVQSLRNAIYRGNLTAFEANLTNASKRALAASNAAASRLADAQRTFLASLDQRFGKTKQLSNVDSPIERLYDPIARREAALSLVANLDLVEVRATSSEIAQVTLRTVRNDPAGHTVTQTETFRALREGGRWKLDIAQLALGKAQTFTSQASAYEEITDGVRAGRFNDQTSAFVALLSAVRYALGSSPK